MKLRDGNSAPMSTAGFPALPSTCLLLRQGLEQGRFAPILLSTLTQVGPAHLNHEDSLFQLSSPASNLFINIQWRSVEKSLWLSADSHCIWVPRHSHQPKLVP